jgi:hypothetical protein
MPGTSLKLLSGQLSPEEMNMSSTAREVLGFYWVLQAASQMEPDNIRDSAILIRGDNQSAVSTLNSFRSPAQDVNRALQKIFELSTNFNFDVIAEWLPRDLMSLEDQLSKIPDSSDWGLVRTEYRRICEAFGVRPSIDLFVSASWHHTPQFISGSYAPGCKAVKALQMAWSDIVREGEFAWVFPPVRYINQVLQLARKYKTTWFSWYRIGKRPTGGYR